MMILFCLAYSGSCGVCIDCFHGRIPSVARRRWTSCCVVISQTKMEERRRSDWNLYQGIQCKCSKFSSLILENAFFQSRHDGTIKCTLYTETMNDMICITVSCIVSVIV